MTKKDKDLESIGKPPEPTVDDAVVNPDGPSADEAESPDRRKFFKSLGRWSLVVASAVAGVETLKSSSAKAEEGEGEWEGEVEGYCDIAPAEWSNATEAWDNASWDNNSWDNNSWDNNSWDNYSDYSKWTAYSDSWVDTWGAWSNSW